MAADSDITHRTKAMQERIFRLACKDDTLKGISLESGIPYSTLRSYAGHSGEPAEMPVSALYKLIGVIPNELLSLLLPEGQRIVTVPENVDHDEIAEAFHDYLATKERAHHPDSPAGREIADCEDNILRGKFAQVKAA